MAFHAEAVVSVEPAFVDLEYRADESAAVVHVYESMSTATNLPTAINVTNIWETRAFL